MICTKTWPAGTSGGMVMVAEPVLGMFWATTIPSVGWMSPLVWSLRVTVLEAGVNKINTSTRWIAALTRQMGCSR